MTLLVVFYKKNKYNGTMLSLFPSFFDYATIAVTVLRITISVIFITEGYARLPKKGVATTLCQKVMPIIELVGGIFLLAGLFTQAAAIILATVSIKKAYTEHKKESDEDQRVSFYVLLFIVSLSFLFLGPGLWSIDYPL